MLALIAAIMFLISLIFQLASISLGPIGPEFLNTLGFLLAALYLGGIGHRSWRR
jgi:hypothetical protein